MQTKLTLRLDQALVRRAKAMARRSGKSVSQLVADYFAMLGGTPDREPEPMTPTVQALRGALRGASAAREDYRKHLEEKYR